MVIKLKQANALISSIDKYSCQKSSVKQRMSYSYIRLANATTAQERDKVKANMSKKLATNELWCVVSQTWFIKWKRYVNYDEDSNYEATEDLHPGPVDNSTIVVENSGKLKPGVTEGEDFILVPDVIFRELEEKYKGGPQIVRKVVNAGTFQSPLYQIDLYPIQCLFYDCPRDAHDPSTKPKREELFSKTQTLGDVVGEYSRIVSNHLGKRCWIKGPQSAVNSEVSEDTPTAAEKVVEETEATLQDPDVAGAPSTVASSRAFRRLTRDVVEVDGDWRLIREYKSIRIEDICSGADSFEIIIESASHQSPYEREWDRFGVLQQWKQKLQVGDVIDVEEKAETKLWREAIVTDVRPNGNIMVHFWGWGSEFDETVAQFEFNTRVLPLHTKTSDWRGKLEEDDLVDVQVSPLGEKRIWITASILDVDMPGRKVTVQYKKSAAQTAIRKSAVPAVADASLSDGDADNANNDNGGVECMNVDGNGGSEATSPDDSDTEVTKCYDLDGEDISELYSHTPKPYSAKKNYWANDRDDWGEKHVVGKPLARGAVGLGNLGNTCYMNSILQCLVANEPLTEFMLANAYKTQLNSDNVMGSGGKLAKAYAKLVKDMWCDGFSKVIPRAFKAALQDFNTQFVGYAQQDSQEAMGSLLDGLHEDLNRIKKKPPVQKIESKGRGDELISREAWRRFLLRNDSVVVDQCYGQLKSHVTCKNPSCGGGRPKESVTFEAFNCLSLPLPIKLTKPVPVTVLLLAPEEAPIKIVVDVEPTLTVADVKRIVAKRLVKLKYLKLEQTSDAAPSTTAAIDDIEADGFLKVEAKDCRDEEDGAAEKKTKLASEASEDARSGSIEAAAVAAEPFYFHAASSWYGDTGKISKNLADTASVSDLTQARTTVFMYQLAHPCALKPVYSYDLKVTGAAQEYHSYVDLYIGTQTPDTYYPARLVLNVYGTPRRLSITKDTTGHDLYEMVYKVVRRFVRPSSPYFDNPSMRPFRLVTTDIYATNVKAGIDDDSDVLSINYSEVVTALWMHDADNKTHFDKEQFDLYHSAPGDVGDDDDDAGGAQTEDVDDSEVKKAGGGGIGSEGAIVKAAAKRKSKGLDIYKCFDKFIECEQLAETETLYCSQCKEHLAPSKKMDIWATPDILIIHLKRFQHIQGQYFVHREKIDDEVDFPIVGLDLRRYVKGPQSAEAPPIYDLFAVSHHSGGLGGGHYTAVCKNAKNGKWYNFNDSYVSETDPSSAVSSLAYVLFYRRQTGSLRWAGIAPGKEAMPDEDD